MVHTYDWCKDLTTLTSLNTTPPTVEGDFSNTSIETLYVPITAIDLYKSTAPWSSIENIKPLAAEVKMLSSLKAGCVITIYPYDNALNADLALSATTAQKQLTSQEKASADGSSWTLEAAEDGAYYLKNDLGLYWGYQQSNALYKPMTLVDDKSKAVAVKLVWNDAYKGIAFCNAKDNTYLCNIYDYNYRYNWYKSDAPLTEDSKYTYVVYLTDIKDTSTGISNAAVEDDAEAQWYNLSGQRVAKPAQSGLYIRNGKKVVIRR